ncbi:MAG TPA: MBL fold metallo-hydrolase [Verrucomicrobiota bacterium]|jgi:7,8-dihydropterin-6-yl-methyl-4-(beta-D-ribofuranosyl)aminobenzene 5'-phosphate synthase|nr:MBL fold metallo-hydrolase [Verrucomicrobiota bacterium]HQL78990.1 MBL fold metallo-hydrolase [Verrucomicrobiota bacterium]
MDEKTAEEIRSVPNSVIWTAQPTEVLEGIFASGEIPRQTTFEDTGGPFYLDSAAAQPDPLLDDQSLFFDTANGVVVLLGCAHSGVVNTVDYIRQLTGSKPTQALLGGLHLPAANPERMENTIAAFRRLEIQMLAPAHCTGLPALAQLWNAFPGRCTTCAVGISMRFLR